MAQSGCSQKSKRDGRDITIREKFDSLPYPARNPRATPRASGFVFCEPKTQMSINAYTFRKHVAECAKVAKLEIE
jgi:hypothetical protein